MALRLRLSAQLRAVIRHAAQARIAPAAPQGARWASGVPPKTRAEAAMEAKLKDVLEATYVNVEDKSGGCGSAFEVECESPKFAGLSKIKQHRLVSSALAAEVADMHSIRIFTKVPE